MGIYHIDASSKKENSITRRFSKLMVEKLLNKKEQKVTYRDVGQAKGLKFVDSTVVGGLFKPEDGRTEEQKTALKPSDQIIHEATDNDTWVIGLPIYNFSMPATFKTWADMLARARKTFKYTENGPVGLLENKKVYVIIASGGTTIDSEIDFCTPWLRQFMKFVGVNDLTIIKADRYSQEKESDVINQIEKEVKNYDV